MDLSLLGEEVVAPDVGLEDGLKSGGVVSDDLRKKKEEAARRQSGSSIGNAT